MRKKLFLLIWVMLALGVVAAFNGCRSAAVRKPPAAFTFVQMGDPQLGFGGYEADLERFAQAVKQINALRPDLVLVCGDLVNHADEQTFADFNAAKARFAVPCYVAPGNHDIGNHPTPQSLARYRRLVGKDYYSFEHKGFTFVVVNAQLWVAPISGETEKQDTWLKTTLETAAQRHQPVIMVCHYPLFLERPDEPDDYFNLPLAKRKELLALFERCGVVAVLAGHTHRLIIHNYHGIEMVAAETTCRNFDHRPFGFRLWHVASSGLCRQEFVPLK